MMITGGSLDRADDPRDALRELDTPLLILCGEYDRIREEVHREYEEVFRNTEFKVVEGATRSVAASPRYPELL
jgi:pimeloyl-ACP methyl ester carboxylesterase